MTSDRWMGLSRAFTSLAMAGLLLTVLFIVVWVLWPAPVLGRVVLGLLGIMFISSVLSIVFAVQYATARMDELSEDDLDEEEKEALDG